MSNSAKRAGWLGLGGLLLASAACGSVGSYGPTGGGGGAWGGQSEDNRGGGTGVTNGARDASYAGDSGGPYGGDAGPRYDAGAAVSDAGAPPPVDPEEPGDAGPVGDAGPRPDADAPDAETPDAEPPAFTCDDITDRSPLTLYLSADDSNSAASPTIARAMIRAGNAVPPRVLRTYEFLNYYNVSYQPAEPGSVRVVPQLRPTAEPGEYDLVVGVQSEQRALEQTRPLVVTFVLDTSGSMGGDRIERERAVVRAIAGRLRAGDVVNATTWDTTRRVVLSGYAVRGPNDPVVLNMAATLRASGGTDLHGGLVEGYNLARRHFRNDALNRVVVVSDGEANVGITDEELIARESHRADGEELYLVGVGVGNGFNDTLMNTVTDRGRGAYVFIDTSEEAERAFGERFLENMDLAVRSVRLELTLPWYARVREFHGEQISTDPTMVDPQHLAPNDAMVFHQVLRACSATIAQPGDELVARATFEDRATRAPRSVTVRTTMGALLEGSAQELHRANAIVAYALALRDAGFAMQRGDATAARAKITDALAVVRAARVAGVPDARGLGEIEELLNTYLTRVLSGRR